MNEPRVEVESRTRELCEAIVLLPGFSDTVQKIEAFMNDELAKFEWQMLNERGNLLREKEMSGIPLTPEEVGAFDGLRDALLAKPVVQDFMSAQEALDGMQKLVYPMLSKTFELGRVPTPEDFLNDSCDSSCGLH